MYVAIFMLTCLLHIVAATYDKNDKAPKLNETVYIPPDAYLNFTQLAKKYGTECEEHDVHTKDGYILKLFHIKGDKTKPVLICHGNIDSADTFIIRGNTSLAIVLANQGYDLWFQNWRGNKYSRSHETLTVKDKAFWDFSYHEIGIYDLAANIDYVLEKTGQCSLSYIGHSQGTEISFVLTSLYPEYNCKINFNCAMAPIAFVYNVPLPTSLVTLAWPGINSYMECTDKEEVFASEGSKSYHEYCTLKTVGYDVCCKDAILQGTGSPPCSLEEEFFPIVVYHYPSSTSRKNFDHLIQNIDSKRFAQYDYGKIKNMIKYNSTTPPDYPLENISHFIALFVGEKDRLADPTDAKLLESKLKHVLYQEFEGRGHIDFDWARDMNDFLFPVLCKLLEEYN